MINYKQLKQDHFKFIRIINYLINIKNHLEIKLFNVILE